MNLVEFFAWLRSENSWDDVPEIRLDSHNSCGDTPLHVAIWAKDNEAAAALVHAGAEVDARGDEAYTPLHVAIAVENVVIARLLIEHGADWNAFDDLRGATARQRAAESPNPDLRAMSGEVQ
jgi:ankyrin repeat protein